MNSSANRLPRRIALRDAAFIVMSLGFMLGCISSSYHSARTTEPGSVSLGAGVVATKSAGESGGVATFIGVDGRAGIAEGLDAGVGLALGPAVLTFWGDVKIQLTNHDLEVGKPILSTGIIKGYATSPYNYFGDVVQHITSIPVMLGLPLSKSTIAGLTYKLDVMSDDFVPEKARMTDAGHKLTLGVEMMAREKEERSWVPRIGFGIGYNFGELWRDTLVFDVGISIESP